MIMNRKKPEYLERTINDRIFQYSQTHLGQKPSKIFVDRQSHIRLGHESDGVDVVANMRNGTLFIKFRDIPVYAVHVDNFMLEFVA